MRAIRREVAIFFLARCFGCLSLLQRIPTQRYGCHYRHYHCSQPEIWRHAEESTSSSSNDARTSNGQDPTVHTIGEVSIDELPKPDEIRNDIAFTIESEGFGAAIARVPAVVLLNVVTILW